MPTSPYVLVVASALSLCLAGQAAAEVPAFDASLAVSGDQRWLEPVWQGLSGAGVADAQANFELELVRANTGAGLRGEDNAAVGVEDEDAVDMMGPEVQSATSAAPDESQSAPVEPVKAAVHDETITTVAIGKPSRGYLIQPQQLQASDLLTVRPKRNYGTVETIRAIEAGVAAVQAKFPGTGTIAVGDLSRSQGGSFRPHLSHQNGRDADIAYYIAGRKTHNMTRVSRRTIDAARTWTFVESWLKAGQVEYLFIDYKLQKPLYEYARDQAGASKAELARWFSYPRGRRARVGIIRHLRGHADHLHVRFYGATSEHNAKAYIAKHGLDVLKPLPVYYKVRRGDYLGKIARRHRIKIKQITRWNRIKRRKILRPGMKLVVGWRRPKLPPS